MAGFKVRGLTPNRIHVAEFFLDQNVRQTQSQSGFGAGPER